MPDQNPPESRQTDLVPTRPDLGSEVPTLVIELRDDALSVFLEFFTAQISNATLGGPT